MVAGKMGVAERGLNLSLGRQNGESLPMTREHNWADNHTFSAARIYLPVSANEVRGLVARSPRIRAIGARHSFNGIADSPGDLTDLRTSFQGCLSARSSEP